MNKTLCFICSLAMVMACSSQRQPVQPPVPLPAARDATVADSCCCCPRDAGVPPVPVDGAVVVVPPAIDAAPPPPLPTGHPRIMLGSQTSRLKAGLSAPAGARWRATVDRWLSGADVYNFAAWNGALLSALTGDARYCVKSVAVVDAQVNAAEVKIAAGANPEVAGDSYLQIGEMIGDLALVYDWCASSTTAAQRARWTNYANQAVSNVWNWKSASWGGRSAPWTGWGVDDPSNNYYYSFLRATMLLGLATTGESAAAATHIAKFRERIDRLVTEFNAQLAGGGSREGTGYGVALRNLWELYALWQWSTGEPIADRTSHTRASLSTMLATWVPTLDRKAPIGDQSRDSTAMLADYERAYVLELIALYPTAPEAARAVAVLAASSVPSMQWGFMLGYDFVYAPTVPGVPVDLPLVRYAAGTGQIYARSGWGTAMQARGKRRGIASSATWLNLIAGPFTQSHAHQDQGSLMIYKGEWLAYDAVITSHSGVRMNGTLVGLPEAHSLVRIEGQQQREGTSSKLLALHAGPGYLFASVDVTPVYAGAVAMVRRQVLWLMPDVVIVQDHVVSSQAQIWQLVVPVAPAISGESATVGRLKVVRLQPATGTWTAFDFRSNSDFSGAWRLDQVQPAGDRTYVTVLSIDGATSTATTSVRFADIGVTFTLDGRAVTLGAGVDPL